MESWCTLLLAAGFLSSAANAFRDGVRLGEHASDFGQRSPPDHRRTILNLYHDRLKRDTENSASEGLTTTPSGNSSPAPSQSNTTASGEATMETSTVSVNPPGEVQATGSVELSTEDPGNKNTATDGLSDGSTGTDPPAESQTEQGPGSSSKETSVEMTTKRIGGASQVDSKPLPAEIANSEQSAQSAAANKIADEFQKKSHSSGWIPSMGDISKHAQEISSKVKNLMDSLISGVSGMVQNITSSIG